VNPGPRFVLDASITITWAMRDEDHPIADLAFSLLGTGSAIVQTNWWYEVRNVLVLNERRARILPDDSELFLRSLEQLRIVVDRAPSHAGVMNLSRKHKLSVYDAAYLELAIRESIGIATLDSELESASLIEGIPLMR
jgi:predicted nucleic acid-binding protein